jgi:ABC-type multidrug transport system fused ATPase/permease subunit
LRAVHGESSSPVQTFRRGLRLSPELKTGLGGTLALAFITVAGKVAVPVAIQIGIDDGLRAPGGPEVGVIVAVVAGTLALLSVTTACSYLMMRRLFTVSETALASVRARAFRHIHDLSMLHQQAERRGALTSRVTSDIDQITQFLQWNGVTLFASAGQIVVTLIVMLFYSWPLAIVVCVAFLPVTMIVRAFQRKLSVAYQTVRERVGIMLGSISESVVGAEVIRAYGVADRTGSRVDTSIEACRVAQYRAQRTGVLAFSSGELAAGLANASVVVVGVLLGVGGALTVGRLTAFLFLVTLFVQPVQIATDVLNEAQNAIAGWRRVLDVLDIEPDVADPGAEGRDLPAGPLEIQFEHVEFAYPDGPPVLQDVNVSVAARARVAVVGETGSGKTTFAKLLTRLMDPSQGNVRVGGVPLPAVRFSSLRRRVVMVPQDGFLFDASIADNVRFGRPGMSDSEVLGALTQLGLADWIESLPAGISTMAGERGESLSVGERQLVSLVRAYVTDPDLLVLDEATSAVDPATEVRLQRTLDAVTRGRTTVAVAHRLATAEAADEVIVFDRGKVVQRGPHETLVGQTDSVYARLHAAWVAQTRGREPAVP